MDHSQRQETCVIENHRSLNYDRKNFCLVSQEITQVSDPGKNKSCQHWAIDGVAMFWAKRKTCKLVGMSLRTCLAHFILTFSATLIVQCEWLKRKWCQPAQTVHPREKKLLIVQENPEMYSRLMQQKTQFLKMLSPWLNYVFGICWHEEDRHTTQRTTQGSLE